MRNKYVLALVGLLIITGFAIGFIVFKNVNEEPVRVVDQNNEVKIEDVAQAAEQPEDILKQGVFEDGDAVHQASGKAQIVKTETGPVLKFSEFSVLDGPDVFVYLSPNRAGEALGDFASLGMIKSHEGDQIYTLPADYEKYQSVVIWCRAFSVTFAKANLE